MQPRVYCRADFNICFLILIKYIKGQIFKALYDWPFGKRYIQAQILHSKQMAGAVARIEISSTGMSRHCLTAVLTREGQACRELEPLLSSTKRGKVVTCAR